MTNLAPDFFFVAMDEVGVARITGSPVGVEHSAFRRFSADIRKVISSRLRESGIEAEVGDAEVEADENLLFALWRVRVSPNNWERAVEVAAQRVRRPLPLEGATRKSVELFVP